MIQIQLINLLFEHIRKLEGMKLAFVEAERNSRIAVLGMEYMIRKLNSGSIKGACRCER